jgi:hypothetical protein
MGLPRKNRGFNAEALRSRENLRIIGLKSRAFYP